MGSSIVALLTNDKVVFGLIVGLPAAVAVLVLIWLRPRPRTPLWGLASVLVIGLAVAGAWAAFHSGGTEASASAPGTGTSGAGPSPAATCLPSGTALRLAARSTAFDTSCLATPAGTAFTVQFTNNDVGVAHSFHIFTANPVTDQSAKSLFQGELITGPTAITYHVGPLQPGTYFFHCDVHPTQMYGAFVVK